MGQHGEQCGATAEERRGGGLRGGAVWRGVPSGVGPAWRGTSGVAQTRREAARSQLSGFLFYFVARASRLVLELVVMAHPITVDLGPTWIKTGDDGIFLWR